LDDSKNDSSLFKSFFKFSREAGYNLFNRLVGGILIRLKSSFLSVKFSKENSFSKPEEHFMMREIKSGKIACQSRRT
jgi:hypothetical protein